MSFKTLKKSFQTDLQDIKDSGLWKNERFIDDFQKRCFSMCFSKEGSRGVKHTFKNAGFRALEVPGSSLGSVS